MPYKGLDKLKEKITEPVVRAWAETLKEGDKTTLHGVLKYLDCVKEQKHLRIVSLA